MRSPAAASLLHRWLLHISIVSGGSWLTAACSGAHEPAQRSTESNHPPLAVIKPTANVPALLGRSIEGLQQKLGTTQEQLPTAIDAAAFTMLAPLPVDSLVTFRTGGLTLVASYNVQTRQVNDLLLLGHHEDSLMHRANLHTGSHDYLVLPAFQSSHPGELLGLRIIPINRE